MSQFKICENSTDDLNISKIFSLLFTRISVNVSYKISINSKPRRRFIVLDCNFKDAVSDIPKILL